MTYVILAIVILRKTTFKSITQTKKEVDTALLLIYILYIYYPEQFKKDQAKMLDLSNFDNGVDATCNSACKDRVYNCNWFNLAI